MSDWPFSLVEKVRFGDLDAMQHLNNVEFLRYFETARIAYMMSRIPEHSPGNSRGPFGFIFAECHIAYRAPGHFGDEVRISIRPAELKRSSMRLEFEMRRDADGVLLAEGWGTLVGYDYAAGHALPIPDGVRERVQADI